MQKLEQAIHMAMDAHAGCPDKAGKPYILHPLRVMFKVASEPTAGNYLTLEEEMIVAVLHDVVEDTPVTLDEIKAFFGPWVAAAVEGVTRKYLPGGMKETYKDFIVRAKQNPVSRKVKIADLLDNLSRIDGLPLAEQSIRERYDKALVVLNDLE